MPYVLKVWDNEEIGTNIVGTLYSDGLLVLEGSGPTKTFNISSSPINNINFITQVSIDNNITTIGNYFFGNTSIGNEDAQHIIENFVLGTNVFIGCENITNINWPSSKPVIPNGTFRASNLETITIPSSVTTIDSYAFSQTKLTSFDVASHITSIGAGILMSCEELANVTWDPSTTTIPQQTFDGCKSLTSFNIPSQTTFLQMYCFRGTGLTSIDIPNTVTDLGTEVFKDCEDLETVSSWSTDVTSIPTRAFAGCKSLTSFNIPSQVTFLSMGCFEASGLTSINIPNTVITMAENVFNECEALETVTNWPNTIDTIPPNTFRRTLIASFTIPSHVTALGNYCLAYTKITSIDIPDTITSIGFGVFLVCEELETITNWSSNLTTIPEATFYGCKRLTSFEIPAHVTTLGQWVFGGDIGLVSFTIPDTVTSMGSHMFYLCENIENVNWETPVSLIPSNTFFGCKSLTSFTIPPHVTMLASSCFRESGLTSIDIPDTVTSVNTDMFNGCEGLETVTNWPNTANSIFARTFQGCKSLTSFTIPSHVTGILDRCFAGSGLTSITIPENVSNLWSTAFLECDQLEEFIVSANNPDFSSENGVLFDKDKEVLQSFPPGSLLSSFTVPDTVFSINTNAFNSSKLSSVTLPSSVTHILAGGFAYSSIASISMSDNITWIGNGAFQGCLSLTSLEFPPNVGDLNTDLFRESGIVSFTIPDNVTFVGNGVFRDCLGLETVNWGSNLDTIPHSIFRGCKSLTSFTIPPHVTMLVSECFRESGLTSIAIPDTVTSVGFTICSQCTDLTTAIYNPNDTEMKSTAFMSCHNLEYLYIGENVTTIGSDAIGGCSKLATLIAKSSHTEAAILVIGEEVIGDKTTYAASSNWPLIRLGLYNDYNLILDDFPVAVPVLTAVQVGDDIHLTWEYE